MFVKVNKIKHIFPGKVLTTTAERYIFVTKHKERINAERRKRGEADIQLTYQWYVDSVPGRSGIAIHTGNYGKDTEGCFLPGENYSYDNATDTYNVWNSKKKAKELFDFFDNYGQNGIKINVDSE